MSGTGRGTVVFAGSLAQRPGVGGHAWVFLQYLLGLRRLGWDVLFLDALEPSMCVDGRGAPCKLADSENLRYLVRVMEGFDLRGDFALAYDGGRESVGLGRDEVLERVRRSALLVNVMGFFREADALAAAPRRVFLDIDPGFGQMWRELGSADVFAGHDAFVTIGRNVGRPGCGVPTCGLEWHATVPPVVLDQWPVREARPGGAFTSVVTWRGPFAPVEFRGKTYGLRVHEFRKFAGLPRLVPGQRFELAMDLPPAEARDIELLERGGWARVSPAAVAGDPWAYREYVAASAAEFMVAKHLYVETRGGWVSDRSVCYLASGRPVVAQDTGLRELYPRGEGLLLFSTPEEARECVEEVRGNYARHARAAREVAEAYFDSDTVVSRLLSKLGAG